jgi:hypothetical protein
MTRYNNSVITKEDFERELRKRDEKILDRLAQKINGRDLAEKMGFDADKIMYAVQGQNE